MIIAQITDTHIALDTPDAEQRILDFERVIGDINALHPSPDVIVHTGDIVRFDADGFMYVTDRLKELIKYKGFQVAPAEVEAALITHPAVADVGVIGVPDDEAGEIPMAFVVAAAGGEAPTLEQLQAHLDGELSHYKQVRRIEIVDAIPKAASGKILRRVLRDRVAAR